MAFASATHCQDTCPICLQPSQELPRLTQYPCGHTVCTPCFEDGKALADKDASIMAATTCALCRKAVYAKTRHGSSLIKHFASEKTSSASSKRGRVAASSTQGRALKRSRSAENAGSAVLLPGAEQLHTQCHTPSHPKAQPSDPRTSTHFYDNNSDEIKAFLRRLETKLQSKLTAPLVASLRPRDRGESSQVSTKPLQLQIAKLRYDKLVHGGQWFGSSCGSNQWDPVLSNFVTRSFKPWFVKLRSADSVMGGACECQQEMRMFPELCLSLSSMGSEGLG